ncbi:MAG: thioredoxin family protein [Planctomycetaceae bacterium]
MNSVLLALAVAMPAHAGEKSKFNRQVNVGDAAPRWEKLPGVDDESHSLSDYQDASVLVVIFTCNHCPVAKAYEQRIKAAVQDFADDGVKFVAISCSRFPADSFEKMKVRAEERDFNFDYLHDESQQIGRAYGASVTPHVFVLDKNRRIAYMGAFDDNLQPDKVKHHYVCETLQALIADRSIEVSETKPKGCPIEYE